MDDVSLGDRGRDVDRHEFELREIRRDYVPREVFQTALLAAVDRITRLEQADNTEKSGNRVWLLGLAQVVIGVGLGIVASLMTARGGS